MLLKDADNQKSTVVSGSVTYSELGADAVHCVLRGT